MDAIRFSRHLSSAGLLLVLASSVATGCGGCGEGNIDIPPSGSVSVIDNPITFSEVAVGERATEVAQIRNTSTDPLTVFSVSLRSRDGASIDDLSLEGLPDLSEPVEIAGNGSLSFEVVYAPTDVQRTLGVLEVVSSDPAYSRDEPYSVDVNTLQARPELFHDPSAVRFPRLLPGQRDERSLEIRNVGSAPLVIHEPPAYSGGQDFQLVEDSRQYPLEIPVYDSDKAQADPDKYILELEVEYIPTGEGGDTGQIQIISNDVRNPVAGEEQRGETVIDVMANAEAPCIFVDGTNRNFGQTPVGETNEDVMVISNCGAETLEIYSLSITENSEDDEFQILHGSRDIDGDGDIDETLALDPGEEQTVDLKYIPLTEGADSGTLTISSNDPVQSELEVSMVGRGAIGQCPSAVATAIIEDVSEIPKTALTAVPLQYIVLDAGDSDDPDGQVVEYEWTALESPDGATVRFEPVDERSEDDTSRRKFRLLTAGKYRIGLKVVDNDGFESCNQAVVEITAIPNEKIHVELTWTNPEDDDQTDELGADVDLHLTKMGPGKWFESPYDIYYDNPNNGPNSADNGIWNPESPSLDIDDTDGAGPENIQLDDPSSCTWYAVGVHYFKQLYGTAYATVRIYINGDLVYERPNKPLTQGKQFWDVARIHWDGGDYRIINVDNVPDVQPKGQAPVVTSQMANSGLCTDVPLY